MTFTQLEYIVAIDDYRSFQRAAKACFVTQPTLSMQVHKLEDHLGIAIFDRSKNPVIPTEMGIEIIEQARVVLRERDKVKVIISEAHNSPSGELKVAVIPTLAPYLLPRFIHEFLTDFPEVQLQLQEFTTSVQLDKLKKGEIDAGILITPLKDNSISEEVLFYERLFLYLSENHPLLKHESINSELLENYNMWLLEEGHCLRTQVINFCDLRGDNQFLSSHLVYSSGSIDTLVRMVDKGQGATVVPALSLEHLSKDQIQRIRPFNSPVPVRQVSIVTYRPYLKKNLLDKLKSCILQNIPSEMLFAEESHIVDIFLPK